MTRLTNACIGHHTWQQRQQQNDPMEQSMDGTYPPVHASKASVAKNTPKWERHIHDFSVNYRRGEEESPIPLNELGDSQ